jgi:hypothetical protein
MAEWHKHETEDGQVYYHNSTTSESVWQDDFEKKVFDQVLVLTKSRICFRIFQN